MPLASVMRMQLSFGVRGSPLLRFSFMVLALLLTGVGLLRITSASTPTSGKKPPAPSLQDRPSRKIPFQLLLSAPASSVEIDSGAGPQIFPPADTPLLVGNLTFSGPNPQLTLTVKWQTPPAPGEHRFAKLTLEAPGQPTFHHVFDAAGDIDDFLELPSPTTRP